MIGAKLQDRFDTGSLRDRYERVILRVQWLTVPIVVRDRDPFPRIQSATRGMKIIG